MALQEDLHPLNNNKSNNRMMALVLKEEVMEVKELQEAQGKRFKSFTSKVCFQKHFLRVA